ncbi:MAG: tRNA glutamyl-Q(34) synthetase GluQRS, partial [Actinomycetota bacterium]
HVPLALNRDGARLAKRDGAVTMTDLAAVGVEPSEVLAHLARSLGLSGSGERPTVADLLERFDPAAVPTEPWILDPDDLLTPP